MLPSHIWWVNYFHLKFFHSIWILLIFFLRWLTTNLPHNPRLMLFCLQWHNSIANFHVIQSIILLGVYSVIKFLVIFVFTTVFPVFIIVLYIWSTHSVLIGIAWLSVWTLGHSRVSSRLDVIVYYVLYHVNCCQVLERVLTFNIFAIAILVLGFSKTLRFWFSAIFETRIIFLLAL